MKATTLLLLAGSISALRIRKQNTWVELPNCGAAAAGKKEVVLLDDLSNATWATCKTKTTPAPQEIGKGTHVWSAPVVAIGDVKAHEHQVTHHPEGAIGPAGPTYALVGRGNRWVELPNCEGKADEVILAPDVANATSATCKVDPESDFGKKHLKAAAAADAKKPAAGDAKKPAAAAGDAKKPAADAAKTEEKPAAAAAKHAADGAKTEEKPAATETKPAAKPAATL